MNLLVKIRNCGALLLCLAVFNSCEEKGSFGLASDDVAPVEFVSRDIDIASSVVQLDSVITAFQARFLVGVIQDLPYGQINSTGYIGINARVGNIPTFDDAAAYDSIRVEFSVSYLHDTSASNRALSLELHRISEEFKDTLYVSSNSLQYDQQVLASGNFSIDKADSVYTIIGDDAWGLEFFDGLKSSSSNFESQENFNQYFPGIAVKGFSDQGNFFGIDPSINFRILVYYNEPNEDNTLLEPKRFELNGFSMPYFFGTTYDRSGTDFSVVQDTNIEYNTNTVAVNSGTGLVTKINFSSLEAFSDEIKGAIINSAFLEVGPIDDDVNITTLPISILVYLTDERNTRIRSGTSFRSIQRDGVNQLSSDAPIQLRYDPETRIYSASITSFVNAYYQDTFRRNEYFLYPIDMNSTLRGFAIDKSKINLKVFYSELR